ncbi:hypothetical protein HY251_22015 [bacterium]|nr:hypothetical protein [bacterium]
MRARALLEEHAVRAIVPAIPELEGLLPGGGFPAGSLVDLHADEGAGALALALAIAGRQERSRTVVVVDGAGDFYPPAAAREGIDLGRLVLVRPGKHVLACLDEALRTKSVAAVVAQVRRLAPSSGHRLRVAAEAGGGLGLLVRPEEERTAVSAAAVRLQVEPDREGCLVLTPLRVRGILDPGALVPPKISR